MSKLSFIKRLIFLLVASTLLLAGCGPATGDQSAPAAGEKSPSLLESSPDAVQEGTANQETGSASSPSSEPGAVIHLPLVSGSDEALQECLSPEAQTMGDNIATTFGTTFEQVMVWHCSGYAFEDILLALQTAVDTKISPGELLSKLDQGATWNQIWEEIGLFE